MSQILITAAKKSGRKKSTNNYEDLDRIQTPSERRRDDVFDSYESLGHVSQELEMNSVSVVPDGEFFSNSYVLFQKYYTNLLTLTSDTFTVSQAVNAFGFGKFQAKLSLFTGLCWMADSMEMTILSILSLALHCDWRISRYQQALATTVCFKVCYFPNYSCITQILICFSIRRLCFLV